MSGTKLRSRAAPATEADAKPVLLIVAHGERGGAGTDQFARELAGELKCLQLFADVRTCFISKEPLLKNVLKDFRQNEVLIYPLFMSDGYFVQQAIPRQIAAGNMPRRLGADVTVLQPLGLHDGLPGVVASAAQACLGNNQQLAGMYKLLLVAHGSRHDRASRQATDKIAAELRKMQVFAGVTTAFLEEAPFLGDQLERIPGPIVAAGLFAGQGMHGGQDLPEAVAGCGRADIRLVPPMSQWSGLSELVRAGLLAKSAAC